MASLLYKLGRFSARHSKAVISAWVALIAVAGLCYGLFGGELSNSVTLPGTATQRVADQLNERFPDASGGTGQVIFVTEDGEPFTADQEDLISSTLTKAEEIDSVKGTVNPFVVQATIESQADQISTSQSELQDGKAQLIAGQEQLDSALKQLDEGQTQLDQAREAAKQAGQLEAAAAALDAQQATIDAGRKEIADKQKVLDSSRAELESGAQQLADGAALLKLTEGVRQVSKDNTVAIGTVQFDVPVNEVDSDIKDQVKTLFADADIPGVEALVSGDIAAEVPEIFGPGEAAGLVIAAVVLITMLGTLIGAGLPLLNALMGVGVGALGALAFSGAVDMLSVTPMLGLMLGLAVGIDYSLFIINRHRKQLRRGVELHESIGLANGTSGNAVVFAGSTVFVALLALNVVGIGFLGMMGTVGAFCVLVAVLVAVTLTPAMLSVVGPRILTKKQRAELAAEGDSDHGASEAKVLAQSDRKPMSNPRAVFTVVVVAIVLLVLAIPALSMRLGLNTSASEAENSSAYRSYSIVNEKFGKGVNGALVVVTELDQPITDETLVSEQLRIGTLLQKQGDVVAVAPIGASDDSKLLAFQVIPTGGPTDESTEQLVTDLRGVTIDGVSKVGVAGNASGNIDISETLNSALPVYLAVVVGMSLIILIIVFRSILVPVTATLGFVLSLFATFGGLTAIFQWGWLGGLFGIHEPGPVLSFLPVITTGILFGLAMDYQLFLVSGMREAYAHGDDARSAVRHGVAAGKSVVIAAALIMVSVFAGFIFADSGMIKSIGFALAFGVLVDAILVRLLLIPALMHLLGESAWWMPKWLSRIIPDIDVEGASLERNHSARH